MQTRICRYDFVRVASIFGSDADIGEWRCLLTDRGKLNWDTGGARSLFDGSREADNYSEAPALKSPAISILRG